MQGRMLTYGFRILSVFLFLFAVGCSPDRPTVDGPPTDISWGYGGTRTYEIPSARVTVVDSASATIFRLPTGGGSLTVRDIVTGPSTLNDEGAFEVEYTGTSEVQLLLPHESGDVAYVMTYAPLDGVVTEYAAPDDSDWLPLAPGGIVSGAEKDTLVFELPPTRGGLTHKALDGGGTSEGSKYKKLLYAKGTDHAALVKQIEANLRAASLSLIDAIPVSRQAKVRTLVNGSMTPLLYVPKNRSAWVWTTKPQYVPFRDMTGLLPLCQIIIPDDHVGSVAHETSHYFHHVLVESDYVKFSWNSRPGHAIGTTGALGELIEDMAYLGEYYLNGTVSGMNPTWGTTLADVGASARKPKTTDFRDLEGMAMAIFAAHTRTDNRIADYAGNQRSVPVIPGDVTEKFRDCYEIVAQGTDDVLEVVEKMESLLQTKYSQGAALPAMLQPLGWSHHVKLRFVNGSGGGVPNVEACSVCKTAQGEFCLPKRGTPSNDHGDYTLDEFYPGKSTLRVFIGGDSLDVADITIPWSFATNQEFTIPNIVLNSSDILITSIDPPAAPPGEDVWIAGSGFGTTPGTVSFGAVPATQILAWVDFGVRAVIPAGAAPGPTPVTARVGTRTSNSFTMFVEDDLFETLHNTTHANVFFLASHSFEPWDAADTQVFSQFLQHLRWDGEHFSGEEREVTSQRRLRITCEGTVSMAQRTLNLRYEMADTTLAEGGPYERYKKASFVNVPFDAINGGEVEFKALGAAVQSLVTGPLEWFYNGSGGGRYTETHWDWSPDANRLSIVFTKY